MAAGRWSDLVWAADHDRGNISRATRRGTLVRLGPGLYTGDVQVPPEAVVARHLWEITAHEFPGAVIADRSMRTGGRPVEGVLHVVHPRTRPLDLPGVRIHPRSGRGPLEGDMPLPPPGLHLASEARTMLESLARPGGRRLDRVEIEGWVDDLCRHGGTARLHALRDHARRVGPHLQAAALKALEGIISAALATGDVRNVTHPALLARAVGMPFDPVRVARFEHLVAHLQTVPPRTLNDLPADGDRRRLLPFYEAYFSNFIEGTEFTLDEAMAIVFDHVMPAERPADAHDILGTYRIVGDADLRRQRPRSADEQLRLLCSWHASVMEGRPDKQPGQFKHLPNRAGSTMFVAPELVEGTLLEAFGLASPLVDPFARAVYMMFVVAEVHPFLDGNGRTARIAMNAELSAEGQVRLIVPTVYRFNYLSALRAATNHDVFGPLVATLDYAQRYTARVDFSTRERAEADLTRTNAFRDPQEAEHNGLRLELP